MQIFFNIFILSFLVRTIRNILHLTYLWQLKEYRFDRMLTHLATPIGKKLILGKLTLSKWMLLITILVSTFARQGDLYRFSLWSFWLLIFLEAIWVLKELFISGWKVPKFTIKILFILGIVSIIQFGLIISGILIHVKYLPGQAIIGPILDKLLGPSIIVLILIFNFVSFIHKKWMIRRAQKKILLFKNLIVIGITGSYGKTSTKEFLATILSEKFKVTRTPEFTNTDIGIAQFILNELKPEHEIFVVEMGAYKRGEIKVICEMVKPKIGIVTGINQQHLELFGSIENTKKAKYELIESLPKDGTAIFNGNNNHCLEMAEWTKALHIKTATFKAVADVKNINIFKDHIEFCLPDKSKNYQFKVNLLGIQTIENLLAAIKVARILSMDLEEVKKVIPNIVSPPKTMQFVKNINGTTIIDDTFNANPDGVMAVIEYMKIFKGKKILVLTPLIELGLETEKIHKFLGEQIAGVCDLILLTNLNYHKSFIAGAKKAGGEDKVQIVNAKVGAKLVRENLINDGVVVFEGKEAGRILEFVLESIFRA